MKNMTLAHITEVCGGIYFGPEEKKTAEVTDIVTDSRKAGEGSLFVAIPGERVDGHKFIPNVASQGALAVISEQKLYAAAQYSGCRHYGKRWKDQYERDDRVGAGAEIPCAENGCELQQ